MFVEFYFDPSCPFCWITSRWLLRIRDHRDIQVTWRLFSLAIKNDELDSTKDETEYGEIHRAAHRVLRVILASNSRSGDIIELYTAFGIAYHLGGEKYDDRLIERILHEKELPTELLAEADNTALDDSLRQSIKAATGVAGQDIGVPIIVFKNEKGESNGYFGPVLDSLPDLDESLRLWDGLVKLATSKHFFELKRSRSGDTPDVASTGKC